MKGSDSSETFTMSFDKLINVTTNLTKPHVQQSESKAKFFNNYEEESTPLNQKYIEEKGILYKPIDLNYNFIRCLILDNVLEHPILYQAFLGNQITNMAQLESFSKVSYTQRFQTLLEKLQTQVKDKKLANERLREQQNKASETKEGMLSNERDKNSETQMKDQQTKSEQNQLKTEQ